MIKSNRLYYSRQIQTDPKLHTQNTMSPFPFSTSVRARRVMGPRFPYPLGHPNQNSVLRIDGRSKNFAVPTQKVKQNKDFMVFHHK